jgi:hypothetical protein
MLNELFNGPVGFHNGLRISGALNAFGLLAANLLCSGGIERLERSLPVGEERGERLSGKRKSWYQFCLEPAYGTAVAG